MSFFKKLRDRMFRSSDRIGEGLEAIVGDEPSGAAPAGQRAGSKSDVPQTAQPAVIGALLGKSMPEGRRVFDDAMLESLEELLIAADMGVETALRVAANIAEGRMGRRVTATEIRQALAD